MIISKQVFDRYFLEGGKCYLSSEDVKAHVNKNTSALMCKATVELIHMAISTVVYISIVVQY